MVVQVGDLIRFISDQVLYSNAGTNAEYSDFNKIVAISGSTVTLETPAHLALTTSGQTVTVTVIRPLVNCSVSGGKMIGGGVTENLGNGFGQCGVYFYGVNRAKIENVEFDGFQGIAVYADSCLDVEWDRGYVKGAPDSVTINEGTNSGFSALLVARCRRVRGRNITGIRVRHVVDANETYDLLEENCTGLSTHRGAFGSHEGVFDLRIVNCNTRNCYSGVINRAFSCIVDGCDLDATIAAITTATMLASQAKGRFVIRNTKCRVSNPVGTEYGVNITGVYEYLEITNPDIKTNDFGVYLQTPYIKNVFMDGGVIDAEVGFTNAYPTGSENLDYFNGLHIKATRFLNYTQSAVILRGSELITAPADNFVFELGMCLPSPGASGNAVLLRSEGWYGDNVLFVRPMQWGDTSAPVSVCPGQPYRIMSAPVIIGGTHGTLKTADTHGVIGSNTSASYVSGATVLKGQILLRNQTVSGQPGQWHVGTGGTEGTLTGVTTSIDIGVSTTTANLTGNDATKVYPGCYITINGAGPAGANLSVRVLTVSADYATATIDTAASTTVSGATTSYRAPTFTVAYTLP